MERERRGERGGVEREKEGERRDEKNSGNEYIFEDVLARNNQDSNSSTYILL